MSLSYSISLVKKKGLIAGVISFLLSGAIYFWTQHDIFFDKYRISDDVFQHTYWMNKFHNPQLFPDDIYVEYSRYLRPWGVKFVYFFLTYLWDPILAGKILGLILFCLSAFLITKIGLLDTDNNLFYALIYCFFFSTTPTVLCMFPGGLDRAFAFPLLFIFYIGLKNENYKIMSITIIAGSIFYPLLYPLMLGLLFIYLIFTSINGGKPNLKERNKIYFIISAIIFPLILLIIKCVTRPAFLGELMSKEEMLLNPLFYPGGRSSYFPFHPYWDYLHKYLFTDFITTLVVSAGIWRMFKLRNWKLPFITFLTCFILFESAKIFFIKLYLPDRYPKLLLTFLKIILLAQGMIFILNLAPTFFLKILYLIILPLCILLYPQNRIYPGIGNIRLMDVNIKKICDYLKDKPPEVYIAAPPYSGDFISAFSEKKVLLKYELTQGWFKNYFQIISQRTLDFFKAYYSNNLEEIINFIHTYKPDYILVDLYYFPPLVLKKRKIYIEPFNKYIKNILTQQHNFLIIKYLYKAEFVSGRYFLIPAKVFFSPPPVAKPSTVFMPHFEHKCQI